MNEISLALFNKRVQTFTEVVLGKTMVKAVLEKAMQGHVVEKAELVGRYQPR